MRTLWVALVVLLTGCSGKFDFVGLYFEEQATGDYKLAVLLIPYKEETTSALDKWVTTEDGDHHMTAPDGRGTLWWGVYNELMPNTPIEERKLDFILTAHGAGVSWLVDGNGEVSFSAFQMTYDDRPV